MGTTLKELTRKVMINLKRSDGLAWLGAVDGINQTLYEVAKRQDWDELHTSTDKVTVASTKSYHLVNDWAMTTLKDIYSLRLIDGANSRRLIYTPVSEIDTYIPYPEQFSTGRPYWYTKRGLSLELIKVPDAVYTIRIHHSNWPTVLELETDESPFGPEIDDVLISGGTMFAQAFIEGDWAGFTPEKLSVSILEERTEPDERLVHRGFDPYRKAPTYDPVTNPWHKRST